MNANLFAALRAAFPADLDATAIECADGEQAGLAYSWRDLERGTWSWSSRGPPPRGRCGS